MKHYGDITKLSGYELPPVDVITGGSPCQDLSVAGKREGLAGERSGLFMEQIRIVKEMRQNDRANGRTGVNIRPRYMVWENVPGAFSSNKGRDFQAVLTEIIKIADPNAPDVPMPEKGKWNKSGYLYDEMGKWSVAWRTHDAQFWGVPQRRKRICVVADFGGATAGEILFDPQYRGEAEYADTFQTVGDIGGKPRPEVQPIGEGLSGDIEQGETARQGTTEAVGGGVSTASGVISKGNGECFLTGEKHTSLSIGGGQAGQGYPCAMVSSDGDTAGTLDASHYKGCGVRRDRERTVVYGISAYESNSMKSGNPHSGIYEADTIRTLDNNGGNPACNQGGMVVLEGNGSRPSHKGDGYSESDVSYTLNGTEQHAVCVSQDAYDKYTESEKSATLKQSGGIYGGEVKPLSLTENDETVGALCASDYKGVGNQYVSDGKCIIQHYARYNTEN